MSGYLVDTNVISELRKGPAANPGVVSWFSETNSDELYLSVLVLGEIRRGIERIRRRDPDSAQHLEAWLMRVRHNHADRILPVTEEIAELWGQFGLEEPLPLINGLLAATASFHDLILVTRNIKDVSRAPVRALDPFV